MKLRLFSLLIGVIVFLGSFISIVYATHSWGGYHWARTNNPFTLKVGDNVSTVWDGHLATASTDWTVSLVLDTTIVPGAGAFKRNCPWTSGSVEVCNYAYGYNGWLGVAQIYISGSHITQGQVKLNDSYFNTSTYNTPAWRQFVMCQEIGHTFGLDHQDEIFNNTNLGTCMDYTNNPSTNQHPNAHDYDELAFIYTHFDTFTTLAAKKNTLPASASADNLDEPGAWGRAIRYSSDGKPSVLVRDLGNGNKVFTFVIWAQE